MIIVSEFPKNCTECEHKKTCQRYYGARGCKYEKEIVNAILERERQPKKKDHQF